MKQIKTVEVAGVNPPGGGAIRAYKMLLYRPQTGITCRSVLIGKFNITDLNLMKSCRPTGVVFPRGRLPFPSSFVSSALPLAFSSAISLRAEDADLVISHHENVNSIRLAARVAELAGSKKLAILQLPPFYARGERFNSVVSSIRMLNRLVLRGDTDIRNIIADAYFRTIWPMWNNVFHEIVSRYLEKFDGIVATSPSIPVEMGEPWIDRIVSLRPGCGFEDHEVSLLGQLRRSGGEPENVAVFPARLVPQKGLADLLLATRLIVRERSDFRLLIIGGSAPRRARQLERAARWLGIRDHISIMGHLPREESFSIRRRAKLVLYPSHVDSYSYTVAESLLMGVPVVAYDIPALRLNFGGLSGLFLVRELDIEALAQRTLEVLEMRNVQVDEPKVKSHGQVAREERIIIERVIGS